MAPPSRHVLMTGAAGRIGSTLRDRLAGRYKLMRLLDIRQLGDLRPGEEHHVGDLADPAFLACATAGIDSVVHLAGIPEEDSWEAILPSNIVGTYNLLEAARQAGVRRVVFASTNHVFGYYRADTTITTDLPVRPDSRYGASKVFGEALGRLYADKHGIEVACLRIGSFRPEPEDARQLATWCSPRDLANLVACCIEAEKFHFIVLHGVSANTRNLWRDDAERLVGFVAQDNAEAFAARFPVPAPSLATRFHGGGNCASELSGSVDDID